MRSKQMKADPLVEAAVDYFAARSHNTWRRNLLRTDPKQKGKPRMRLRGGEMVDVNQPWSKLHPKARAENRVAAQDAFTAVKRFPKDREAAADYVHKCWIKRNKNDSSQPKALFAPYNKLPEVEKDKDRVHVDLMRQALKATSGLRKKAPGKGAAKAKRKRVAAHKTVRVDAKSWRRLEAAAKRLSKSVGREIAAEALLSAGAEAVAAVCEMAARKKR